MLNFLDPLEHDEDDSNDNDKDNPSPPVYVQDQTADVKVLANDTLMVWLVCYNVLWLSLIESNHH